MGRDSFRNCKGRRGGISRGTESPVCLELRCRSGTLHDLPQKLFCGSVRLGGLRDVESLESERLMHGTVVLRTKAVNRHSPKISLTIFLQGFRLGEIGTLRSRSSKPETEGIKALILFRDTITFCAGPVAERFHVCR